MNLLAWALWAAALAGGDDKDSPARRGESAPLRRQMPLSAREAVSLSLNHNLDIEVARFQPWIEDQNIFAAMGLWDHTLYASVSEGRDVSQGVSSLSGSAKPRSDDVAFTVGLRKLLPFGGSYDLSFSNDRSESNNSFLLINPNWSQTFGGTLMLPLLQGRGTAANTATLVIARNTREQSVDAFEKSLGDSVFQVMQAYWDLVFAIENKKVKDQSLEVALRLLEDTRRKLDRGLAARIDVTQAEAGVASQQEGILTAEAAVFSATDKLKRLVDPSLLRDTVLIVPVDAPRVQAADLDEKVAVDRALEEALLRRPEVRQLRMQLKSQDALLVQAENNLLPKLDLVGSGFLNGSDGSFGQSNKDVRGGDFYNWSVLLSFEYPLEQSSARGAFHRAELEKRRFLLQVRNLENQVLVEVRDAVRSIKTDEKRIEATRRARILAQEQLDGEISRNEHGLSTTFRVLDVQKELVQARTNELKALIDYNLAWHTLHKATGTLLDQNGIVLKENLQPRLGPAGR
ncbi:MAG: TolC family protein [Planctomycetes bacterium]|nr:TolC family protein [Planctomycetota bacterium]